MSDETQSSFNLDSIRHLYRWDEIEGYQRFQHHLELSQGFAVVVLVAPDTWGIQLAREQIADLVGDGFQRICFDPDAPAHALSELVLQPSEPDPSLSVVWVDSDPVDSDKNDHLRDAWQQALARLNRYRNSLESGYACTLVFAMPSRFQQMFRESAPDIWSIRSAVFQIEPPDSTAASIQQLPPRERTYLERPEADDTGDPAEALAEARKFRGQPGREILVAKLLQRAGNQFRTKLDFDQAAACLEEAYSIVDQVGGDVELSWDIAINLASVFNDVARYDRAEYYLRIAMNIASQFFGNDDRKTAITLNNLAQVLLATNRLSEAEPLMREALKIDKGAYGDNHPNVAIDLNNLAQVLLATNRLSEAEPLMRETLKIDKGAYGDNHPEVATGLNNLAQLLKATNRLSEAEPLMREALKIDKGVYGDNHPNVAIDLNNLAQLLQATNRLSEAEPMMREALEIDKGAYGDNHPNVARDLGNLAMLLDVTNRLSEAEPLMREALKIDKGTYGDNHPKVAIKLSNLAQLLKATNRLSEAEPLMREALKIDKRAYGDNHPNVATDLNNLAQLLQATDRLTEAEPMMARAFRIFHASLGAEHPSPMAVEKNYRSLLGEMDLSEQEIEERVEQAKVGG